MAVLDLSSDGFCGSNPPRVTSGTVLEVGRRQFHIRIQEFLLGNDCVDDVLNLHASVSRAFSFFR
jgi:hypothetical protein